MYNAQTELSNDQLLKIAPSIFADSPWEGMSDKYRFIPTIEVIEAMRENNFVPVKASQSAARIEGKQNFTKHMIRFRHKDYMTVANAALEGKDNWVANKTDMTLPEIPEIVLVNSHDGSSAYNLMAGLFRLVCRNGLILQSGNIGSISVRHSGKKDTLNEVIEGSYEIIENAPIIANQVADLKQIELRPDQQEVFAKAAIELKGENAAKTFNADRLLQSRRYEDKANDNGNRDLWKTFNVIQENIIQGGIRGRSQTGRRTRSKPVQSVSEDVRINKALWVLTEQMAKLAA